MPATAEGVLLGLTSSGGTHANADTGLIGRVAEMSVSEHTEVGIGTGVPGLRPSTGRTGRAVRKCSRHPERGLEPLQLAQIFGLSPHRPGTGKGSGGLSSRKKSLLRCRLPAPKKLAVLATQTLSNNALASAEKLFGADSVLPLAEA